MEFDKMSRRTFLAGSGAGAVGVMLGGWSLLKGELPGLLPEASAAESSFSPIVWVRIAPDNVVTIYSPGSEMGQGTMTSIPRILAEDMELDWSRVKVEQAPANAKVFGNPGFGGGLSTGASHTVMGYYPSLRLAGLQARLVLEQAAAQAWGVSAGEVRAENGMLVHEASKRRMSFGEVARTAKVPAVLPVVDKNMLKPMSAFKIIGKDVPRVELAAKSDGTAKFGIDIRLPGMLWASVQYAPVMGEKQVEVNDAAALAVPGVKKVVQLPGRVAVVADSWATARKARDLLDIKWTRESKTRAYDSETVMKEFIANAENLERPGTVYESEGDFAHGLAGAARTFRATYTSEHVAQVALEPMNCTAQVTGDAVEVWVPSQSASGVIRAVTGAGFKPESVRVRITLMGGGYGGRGGDAEYCVDAALLAKAMPGVPIQVIWSREDTFLRTRPRPMTAQHIVAGVDKQGKLVAWRHRVVAESIMARLMPPFFAANGGKDAALMDGSEAVYQIEDKLIDHYREQRGLEVGFWRAVGTGHNRFAMETMIDEIAVAGGKDPLQFRLDMTSDTPRAQAVLREAAAMAGWGGAVPAGRAQGLAFSDSWNSFLATVVEVSMDKGVPVVHRMWSAVDCGHAISPANVKAQIEGAALFGLSASLGERLVYKGGELQQHNLDGYPLLRADRVPAVQVKVMPTDNPPGGIGEVGLPCMAPAVANAVAKLTGTRIRALPFPQVI